VERRREVDGRVSVEKGRIVSPWVELVDEGGIHVGTLHLLPRIPDVGPAPEERLLTSVDRWLWLAVILGGIFALVATAAVARRILGPVEQLTEAARRMAGGELQGRVEVRSRDEVGQLAEAFNQMAEGLERQERLRQQMVTDVAHDLRTPLTSMRGQLEAIQDGLLEATPEVITSLHEEVLFLSDLIRDLQDLSLADAGKLRLDPRRVDVAPEVGRVIESVRASAPGPGPTLENDVPDLPPVLADPVRFRQIVHNLVANALAHTAPTGTIRIEARDRGDRLEISVTDDGVGIEPEHLPHVFERFYRADESRGRDTGGAGLGLAIVKQLVQAQGGEVRVESRPGEGSRFSFTMPRTNPPAGISE
jgi:signal transduction histidine kinase